jgi:HD-like signal output (HDOD) protein
MSVDTTSLIVRAPRDVAGWAALFDPSTLPVLASTAHALEELRPAEDAVDAHMLSEAICTDPLMTIKVLALVAKKRRGRGGSDTETVREALVMLGIPPFFHNFGPQESVVARLAGQPEAVDGFYRVLRRSLRAARFALVFANHRMDHDAPVLHEAALLHDFVELMLWFRAPTLALEIARRQQEDPTLRSAAVQREVLNIELADLQQVLMTSWRLPSLLVADHQRPRQLGDSAGAQCATRHPCGTPQRAGLGQPGTARRPARNRPHAATVARAHTGCCWK